MEGRTGMVPAMMIAAVLLAAAGAAAPTAGTAKNDGEPTGPPRIRFEQSVHDFGKIRSDRQETIHWRFYNDGGEPLQIIAVRPTCGCTATVLDHDQIPPGGTGTLKVVYDPAGQQGSVRKSILVSSNDPARPNLLLTIRAHVTPAEFPKMKKGHPPFYGQSLLIGSCAECHAAPAAGKSGKALYGAICAMCHGDKGAGGIGPSLRNPDYLSSHDDQALLTSIAYGTVNPKMPGFSQTMGGPLSEEQIRSLVLLLRAWDSLPSSESPAPVPGKPPASGR